MNNCCLLRCKVRAEMGANQDDCRQLGADMERNTHMGDVRSMHSDHNLNVRQLPIEKQRSVGEGLRGWEGENRLSTLENNRVYNCAYPLLVLTSFLGEEDGRAAPCNQIHIPIISPQNDPSLLPNFATEVAVSAPTSKLPSTKTFEISSS